MKMSQNLAFLAAACALLVAATAIIRPRVVKAAVATLVEDVNGPALQPFAMECNAGPFQSSGNGVCPLTSVPAGKRFVIATVSGQLALSSGTKPISIGLQVCSNGKVTDNYFTASFQGNSSFFTGDYYSVSQPVVLYHDNTGGCSAAGAPVLNITAGNPNSGANLTMSTGEFTLSGYLINVS